MLKLSLSLIGSVLLIGNAPAAQKPEIEANIAINRFEDGILPLIEDEVQTLTSPSNNSNTLTNQNNPETQQRQRFLQIQAIFAASVGLSALALASGVQSYRKQHQLQRLEFLRRSTREFENDPGIAQALKILDFEEHRDYFINTSQGTEVANTPFKVTNQLLSQALASSEDQKKDRKDQKKKTKYLAFNNTRNYYAESSIRDWFNQMLNGLEHFDYMVKSGVFSVKEVKPWLNYWARLIADETYRRNCDARVYDRLYNYIYDHGFDGVKHLFEKLGYRILRSPYKRDDFDFKKIKDLTQYNTKIALSMAKISRLVYQDMDYAMEIAELWGVKNIYLNSKYFNTKERDTQAFMFRANRFIVLAFRGTQEISDWTTNLSTELRTFTIRKRKTKDSAYETTFSEAYNGKVHKGFFLGWADIERPVLARLDFWRKKNNGKPLPP
ncbi:MAG: hypothetical protein F6K11_30920, partial [Leptolyngbya sp. SIO3F4]|nr:hypothetical protein [Leptolyngbya sp. SIO3F4]